MGSIVEQRGEAGARYHAEVMATDIEMVGMRECNTHMAWVVDILDGWTEFEVGKETKDDPEVERAVKQSHDETNAEN